MEANLAAGNGRGHGSHGGLQDCGDGVLAGEVSQECVEVALRSGAQRGALGNNAGDGCLKLLQRRGQLSLRSRHSSTYQSLRRFLHACFSPRG